MAVFSFLYRKKLPACVKYSMWYSNTSPWYQGQWPVKDWTCTCDCVIIIAAHTNIEKGSLYVVWKKLQVCCVTDLFYYVMILLWTPPPVAWSVVEVSSTLCIIVIRGTVNIMMLCLQLPCYLEQPIILQICGFKKKQFNKKNISP